MVLKQVYLFIRLRSAQERRLKHTVYGWPQDANGFFQEEGRYNKYDYYC